MIRGQRAGESQRGFSLLEMVVAVAILGISLAALYEIVGGATRIVRVDEKYAYAVELAQSLLADNAVVPREGFSNRGETSGAFRWQVNAAPIQVNDAPPTLEPGLLQEIVVTVSWEDGANDREVSLHSVVAGMEAPPI